MSTSLVTFAQRAALLDVLPTPVLPQDDGQEAGITVAELLDPAGNSLEMQLAAFANARHASADVSASLLTGDIARSLTALSIFTFFTERKVPFFDLERTQIFWNERGQCASVRPPAATSVVDANGVETLVESFAGFTGPLVDVTRTVAAVGRRALWSGIATAVGAGFLVAGRSADQQSRARDEAEQFFAAAGRSWRVQPEWISVDFDNAAHLFLLRRVCCLAYKLPEATYCSSCPLQNHETRTVRLVNWLQSRTNNA